MSSIATTIFGACLLSVPARLGFRSSASCTYGFFYLSTCTFSVWHLIPYGRSSSTFKHWWRTGKTLSSWPCRPGYRFWWVTLYLSQPRVPLFPRIWTPMRCGRRVPLVTERHRGLNISPVQRELTVAPGPGDLQVMCLRQAETDGLTCDSFETPVPHHPHLADHHHHSNGWEPPALVLYAARALRMTTGTALFHVAIELLLILTPAVTAVPLTPSLNDVGTEIVPLSLVGTLRPAWLGDLPGMCLWSYVPQIQADIPQSPQPLLFL